MVKSLDNDGGSRTQVSNFPALLKYFIYWTMGSPIGETTIVNRARKEDSYEYSLKNKMLPGKGD